MLDSFFPEASCKSCHCKTTSNSSFICVHTPCVQIATWVFKVWISTGTQAFAGVTRTLCVCKPALLEHGTKWRIMQEAPCSKSVRQGDPREQGCVWKIWRSVWSSMTASFLLYTPPFSNSSLTATCTFKIGCSASPQSIHTCPI